MSEAIQQDALPACPSDLPDLLEAVTAIGAPTGKESRRVDFIQQWIERETGLSTERDAMDNLVVDLSGGASNVYLMDAHTDTVFADETLTIEKDGDRWKAPGIFDNTIACVQLMLMLRELAARRTPLPFLFSFTVCEEGQGNMRGIKEVVQRYGDRLAEACIFDGDFRSITVGAVGSARWKIRFTCTNKHN